MCNDTGKKVFNWQAPQQVYTDENYRNRLPKQRQKQKNATNPILPIDIVGIMVYSKVNPPEKSQEEGTCMNKLFPLLLRQNFRFGRMRRCMECMEYI